MRIVCVLEVPEASVLVQVLFVNLRALDVADETPAAYLKAIETAMADPEKLAETRPEASYVYGSESMPEKAFVDPPCIIVDAVTLFVRESKA